MITHFNFMTLTVYSH